MRSTIKISGDDRIAFLQGIVTQDVSKLAEQKVQFAALLSPQGKLLHDMFLIDAGEHILLDTHHADHELLMKRLRMYKLRAKVTLEETDAPAALHADPRHPLLPPLGAGNLAERVALGVPEFGIDIQPDSMTAMDAGYDLLNAISFTKGCYVGQEVTARMHYKAIARKGFFKLHATQPPEIGAALVANGKSIGTVSSVYGDHGLVFLKFEDAHRPDITLDGHAVKISAPDWMAPKLALFENAAQNQ